ncbi:MAG: hypothetical protein U5Q44_05255 [Dehalococcoidia bacterium]|nr:hypothetical protein [Dehalococcoidia bacterium]
MSSVWLPRATNVTVDRKPLHGGAGRDAVDEAFRANHFEGILDQVG